MAETRIAVGGIEAARHASVLVPVVLAVLFGSLLLVGTGFASIPDIHNAAHDARHAFAFPCH